MKKGVLVCALALLLSILVAAPASAATKFSFGLKAGLSMSNVRWTDDDGLEKALFQPTFGGFVLVPLGSTLALQPEVNYLVMGETWDTEEGKVTEKFTFLQIPILLRARLMKEGKFVPIVFAGPAVSFLMSASETGVDTDIKEFFKSTDIGAIIGAGGEFGVGKMKVLLDLRYVMGLTNDYLEPDILLMAAPINWSMKTAAFVFSAGIIF
jgi:hypothetical protein